MDAISPSDADSPADNENGDPVYAYKPNLMGAPWVFSLRPDGLQWDYGRRSGLLRYDEVTRVRMSYRPATLQTHRFITEIWAPESPKLQIASTSFRGLMEQARQDDAYSAFVRELHSRLAAARSGAKFETGMNPILYWLGGAVMAALALTLATFLIRVVAAGDWKGALVLLAVLALFGWQAGAIFYRNRPQAYRPEAPPGVVLPGTG